MAITERYVTADSDGGDGSSGNPWTLTEAMASAAAGDRVNVKKGTYSRTASDTITVDGSVTAPIIWRGYNTSIGDLDGVGRTNGNGAIIATDFPVIAYDSGYSLTSSGGVRCIWQCVKFTGTYAGGLIVFGLQGHLQNCVIENASTNAAAIAAIIGTGSAINCDVSHTGASGSLCALQINAASGTVYGCRITGKAIGIEVSGDRAGIVLANNLIHNCGGVGIDLSDITTATNFVRCCGNTIVSCAGGGILGPNSALTNSNIFIDNHITDCTGYGIDSAYKATAEVMSVFAFNRTRDNSSGAIDGHDDWAAGAFNHVTTDTGGAETDFVNAAGGDFELIPAAPGRGKAAMGGRDIGATQVYADFPAVANVTEDDTVDGTTGTYPNPTTIAAAMWNNTTSPDRSVTA